MNPKYSNIHVKLTGVPGSTKGLFVMGKVHNALRENNIPKSEITQFITEAGEGDFDNLLRVCVRWVTIN